MKISFVIPTLNFAAFITETLDSIVNENYAETEIVVFDGGSTDNTLEVLEAYKRKFPSLKVICAEQRGNIDIDLNAAVSEASGDYIWTLSADDTLISGWSLAIPSLLSEGVDLVLVPAIHCDVAMRPRRNYPILREPGTLPFRATIATDAELFSYLAQVRNSEGLFSFCSACLVRRERLSAVASLEEANGTCWRYSARLIAVLTQYPCRIAILPVPRLYKRGENDSFAHAGPIRRLKIATQNWDRAIASLRLGDEVTRAMQHRAKSDIRPTSLLYLTQFIKDRDERAIFNECVSSRLGGGGAVSRAAGWAIAHFPQLPGLKQALLVARPAYRKLQQRTWSARLNALSADVAKRPRSVVTRPQ